MKIPPIPEAFYKALCLMSNEVKDILLHATEHDFTNNVDYLRLVEAQDTVEEFILCHDALGGISQRGEVPQCWNKNTIWTPYREIIPTDYRQQEFDWNEDYEKTEEVNTNDV